MAVFWTLIDHVLSWTLQHGPAESFVPLGHDVVVDAVAAQFAAKIELLHAYTGVDDVRYTEKDF
jgi:hypothetical protein